VVEALPESLNVLWREVGEHTFGCHRLRERRAVDLGIAARLERPLLRLGVK